MALLTITTVRNGMIVKSRCGGSIISEEWVLTAAHCVSGRSPQQFVEVLLGEYDTTRRDGTEVKRYGTQVVLNSFNPSSNANDIALIKLNQRLDFKSEHKYLQPICLPTKGLKSKGDTCFATGWGSTYTGGRSVATLQEVKLPELNDYYCQRLYRFSFNGQKQICAGFLQGGRDTCQGDSGGPLSCQLPNGVWIQEGITSYGNGCAQPMSPGVYTKVAAYVPWIQSVTGIQF